MELREYKVWDRSQRIFHWVNALAVLALAAIGIVILNADALGIPDDPGMIGLKSVHVYVGYVFIVNLAWRAADDGRAREYDGTCLEVFRDLSRSIALQRSVSTVSVSLRRNAAEHCVEQRVKALGND